MYILSLHQISIIFRVMSDESCFRTDRTVRRQFFISYQRLKTRKHLVSICFYRSGFSFYEHFNMQITEAFFYIQNRNMCLSKNHLYQHFVVFCPAWDSFTSENILYVIV